MEWLAAIGGGAFLVTAIAGGVRLLLLARRTRKLPEFALGAALIICGAISTPLAAIAKAPLDAPDSLRAACFIGHAVLLAVGMSGIGAFNWVVFRASSRWAAGLTFATPITMLAALVWILAVDGVFSAIRDEGLAIQLFGGLTILPLAWSAYESGRYSLRLHRQARIGLGNPAAFNRMILWAVAMTIGTLLSSMVAFDRLLGQDIVTAPMGILVIGVLGTIASIALCLAFLPPRSYVRWVEERGPVSH